jgi:hypothetical protein
MKNWQMFIGNGDNFINTIKYNIWRIQSDCDFVDYFLNKVKNGDILWFVLSGVWNDMNGQVVGCAIYMDHKIDIFQDIEIHYSNLIDYRKYNLYSDIIINVPVRICKKLPDIQYLKKRKIETI